MPATTTLSALRSAARRLTNTEYAVSISDADLTAWVNDALRELWGAKASSWPDIFSIRDSISTTAGTQLYDLPDDFMALLRIDRVVGSRREQVLEAPPLLELELSTDLGVTPIGLLQYRIVGGGISGSTTQLLLTPDPGTYTYEIWYTQAPQRVSLPADEVEITYGEDAYLHYAVAARIMERQMLDSTPFRLEQQRALASLVELVKTRNVRTRRVVQTRTMRRFGAVRRYPAP